MNIALIAEYLGVAKNLGPGSTASDYARANGLALRCMIELPSSVWERVLRAVVSPTWQGALDLAFDLRAETMPDDPLDPARHAVFHGPSAGVKPR